MPNYTQHDVNLAFIKTRWTSGQVDSGFGVHH